MGTPRTRHFTKAEVLSFLPDTGRFYNYMFKRYTKLIGMLAAEAAPVNAIARALLRVEPLFSDSTVQIIRRHLVPFMNEHGIEYVRYPSPNPLCRKKSWEEMEPRCDPEKGVTTIVKFYKPEQAIEKRETTIQPEPEHKKSPLPKSAQPAEEKSEKTPQTAKTEEAAKPAESQATEAKEMDKARPAKTAMKKGDEVETKPVPEKPIHPLLKKREERMRREKEAPVPERTKEDYWREGKAAPVYLFALPPIENKCKTLPPPETKIIYDDWDLDEVETDELVEYYRTLKFEYDYLQHMLHFRDPEAKTPKMRKLEKEANDHEYYRRFDEMWQNEYYHKVEWQKIRTRRIEAHLKAVEKEMHKRNSPYAQKTKWANF